MFEDLKEEEIVNKVGGRFKLSTLIQKRMVALNTGAKPLVDNRSERPHADRPAGDPGRQDLPGYVRGVARARATVAGPRGRGRRVIRSRSGSRQTSAAGR